MKEMRKRFHFDPQTHSHKPQPINTKQRISEIIMKDQNG